MYRAGNALHILDNGIAATGLLPFLVFLFHQLAALRAAHYKLNNLAESITLPVCVFVLHEIEHQPLLLEHHFFDTHSAEKRQEHKEIFSFLIGFPNV